MELHLVIIKQPLCFETLRLIPDHNSPEEVTYHYCGTCEQRINKKGKGEYFSSVMNFLLFLRYFPEFDIVYCSFVLNEMCMLVM